MQTGQYAPYPNPRPKEVDFGVIAEGFGLITKNWPMFTLTAAIALLIYFGISATSTIALMPSMMSVWSNPDLAGRIEEEAAKVRPLLFGIGILSYAVLGPFGLSMTKMALKAARGQALEFADIGFGFTKIGRSMAASVLLYLGYSLWCLPALIAGAFLMLLMPLLADTDKSFGDAVSTSFQTMSKHFWMALLLTLTVGILGFVGFIGCCIGILVTFPLIFVCPALVYRDLTDGPMDPPSNYAPASPVPEAPRE